ncbi:TonB-dependent receptor [Candidatus Sulfopaludibacter sp. SbA3]|nr:TonB-dependent receptor [Candidatus Sulfopaludibacter sp. SbA3]
MRQLLVTLLAVLLSALPLASQTDTSSLEGRVTDPQGGAVAGAQIQLTNQATGAVRKVLSGASGNYIFTLIPPGRYDVEAGAAGFRTSRDTGLQIDVAAPARLDIVFEVGAVTERVEVTSAVSLLNTETAAQGTIIGEEKIQSLPLNGRQFIDLALLSPNVTIGGSSVQQNKVRLNQDGGFSASGNRTNNNGYMLDGISNLDLDYMSLSLTPILDTLAEFQVQTGQQTAEYGHAGGAQINVVTKSGGNEWHGGGWEFVRNRVFDSRPFNLFSALPKFQRNQFGGTVGGPVRQNKLFVFAGYERLSLRQAAAGLTTVTVPTPLERQGNFTASKTQIYDALATPRTPFPGDTIPQSRLNPLAVIAINAVPAADVPSTSNKYINSDEVLSQDSHNYSVRFDYVATSAITMFGRYSATRENDSSPGLVPGRAAIGVTLPQNAAYGLTWVLSPRSVNELRAGVNRMNYSSGVPEPLFNLNGAESPLPYFKLTSYADMGGAGGGNSLVRDNTYQVYDNWSYQIGRHMIKAGAEFMFLEYVPITSPNAFGTYQFSSGQSALSSATDGTGSVLASFLLGYSSTASRSLGGGRMDGHQPNVAAYIQDQFRLSNTLTVNLGLRYEIAPPLYDTRGQTMGLDFSKVPSAQAIFASGQTGIYEPTFFICGQTGYPKGCAYTDKNNFAPRFGLAWQAAPTTVFRMGAGIYYSLTDFSSISRLTNSLPANIAQTLTNSTFAATYQGYGASVFPPNVAVGPSLSANLYSLDLHQRTSYAIQLSSSVQHQIGKSGVLEMGYLGTLGLKLQQNVQVSNSLPGSTAVAGRRPYVGAIFTPGTVFPYYINVQGTSVGTGTMALLPNTAQSNYHSLYLRGERRFSGGISYLSSFTFSKAITNAPQFRNAGGATGSENSPPQNSYDLSAERGLAAFNAKFRWVNSAVYDLPFGAGRAMLKQGFLSQVLGGWQVAGIMSLQTGFPFTINITGDSAGIGGGSGGILIRGNPVPGQSAELSADRRSTAEWFNTAAFVAPPAYQFGLLGRNTVVGPGIFNIDTTLSRHIRIRERLGLEIRAEAFNLFNTPNYNQIGRIINASDYGQVDSQLPPRQLQFGAKVTF